MTTKKQEIRNLVAKNKLAQAIELLEELSASETMDIQNEVLAIFQKFNKVNRASRLNIISREASNLELNQVTNSILELVNIIGRKEKKQMGPPKSTNPFKEEKRKILFLGVTPKDQKNLRIDQEVRDIEDGLKRSQNRDKFDLVTKFAVRIVDLRRALLDEKPNILHFSGHGGAFQGLAFENDRGEAKLVPTKALSGLFGLFKDHLDCVLLNACYADIQAAAIVEEINFVIGPVNALPDKYAITYSIAFYDALGAGKNYEFAHQIAQNALQLESVDENLIPRLHKKY